MPIYEYRCKKCGKQFEAFQGISEPDLKTCKFCKGKVQKMMSLSSFSLKGTGWYATDYAGKKTSTAKTAKKEEASADSTSTVADTSSSVSGKEE